MCRRASQIASGIRFWFAGWVWIRFAIGIWIRFASGLQITSWVTYGISDGITSRFTISVTGAVAESQSYGKYGSGRVQVIRVAAR